MFNCCYSYMPMYSNIFAFGRNVFSPSPSFGFYDFTPNPRPYARPIFGFGYGIVSCTPFVPFRGLFGGLLLANLLSNSCSSSATRRNNTVTTNTSSTTSNTTSSTATRTAATANVTSTSTAANKTSNPVSKEKTEKLRSDIVSIANSYIGASEDNGGYKTFAKRFLDGSYSTKWCCDFVSYVVKKAYRTQGLTIPKGFGNHDCRTMQQWAINNNKYYDITKLSGSDRANAIAQNVHPGDLMLLLENNSSHIGVVTKVNSDGSFETMEGNRDNEVKPYSYSADEATLSGFVQLTA